MASILSKLSINIRKKIFVSAMCVGSSSLLFVLFVLQNFLHILQICTCQKLNLVVSNKRRVELIEFLGTIARDSNTKTSEVAKTHNLSVRQMFDKNFRKVVQYSQYVGIGNSRNLGYLF